MGQRSINEGGRFGAYQIDNIWFSRHDRDLFSGVVVFAFRAA